MSLLGRVHVNRPCSRRFSLSRSLYLDVVTLEEVQVGFALSRLFTHQSQDGVVAAGAHHSLAVLQGPHGKVFQLILHQQQQQEEKSVSESVNPRYCRFQVNN